MGQYIVSARKYRPDSFESLIGQDIIVQTLKNSIKRGQLAHAYLFCGPRGVGKTSAARIFAKTINCEHPDGNMEPCGECESCVSFREGRSYCIHELDAASNNGVDDIKLLMEQVQIPPQVGHYSVFIIDEVHMLTASAFNAFLKTLEEPPAHAIFILATTEKHKILPTILSRCQTYDFNRIGIPDMVSNLRMIAGRENITIDDESLHVIARKADGAMRDALTIFDQTVAFCGTDVKYEDVVRNLNVLDYENCFELVEDFLKGDYAAALLKFDEILSKGFNALYFVSALSSHFRDLAVCKSGGADSLIEYPDSLKSKYYEQAGRCPIKFIYDALTITTQCESGYKAAVNPRLHIEFTLMKLSYVGGGAFAASASASAPVSVPRPVESAVRKTEAPANAPAMVETVSTPVTSSVAVQAVEPVVQASSQPISSAVPQTEPSPAVPQASEPVVPAAAPRARRRATKSASSLSISSIQETAVAGKAAEEVVTVDSGQIPDDHIIEARWKLFAKEYASRPRLASTLASAKIELSLKDDVKYLNFFVMNEVQRQWLQEKILRELEQKMQADLGTKRLRLEISVIPEEEVQKNIYLPQDQARDLMSKNEEVKNLIVDFGLETK